MSNFDMILKKTKESLKESKLFDENKIESQNKKKENRKTTTYDKNSREVEMILNLGLKIDLYEPADPEADDYDAMEFYFCSNDRWNVYIRNLLYDADLGSVLQVLDLTDKFSGEKVHFYCDLWCKNTSKSKLEQLKILLDISFEDYIDLEFGIYFDLPELLTHRGYIVKNHNYTFDATSCLGFLEISNPELNKKTCKLTISHANSVETLLQKMEDIFSLNKVIYRFEYKEEDDIVTLCEMIDCFLLQIDGKHGFFENGVHYTNTQVDDFFKARKKLFPYTNDETNSWNNQWDRENMSDNDWEAYRKMKLFTEINHYNGAEIYKKYKIHLNRDSCHSGGIDNIYEFEIFYNTNFDKENCVITIKHTEASYIGYNNINRENENIDNTIYKNEMDVVLKGSYLEVMGSLDQFLKDLAELEKTT
jgi:hypothetical protein